jgi:hypothetical protein
MLKLTNIKVEILLQRKTHKHKSVFITILKVADIFGNASTCIEIKDKMAHW